MTSRSSVRPNPSFIGRLCLLAAAAALLWVARPLVAWQAAAPDDERTLRLIVVGTAEEAAKAVDRLRAGEGFAPLAREISIDPTAGDGGMLGTLKPSALREDLRRAIASLKPGQVSGVVPVPTGFAIVQVVADDKRADPSAGAAAPAGATAVTPAVSAAGSVKYVFGLSGFGDALVALRDFPKPSDWNHTPRGVCDYRTRSLVDVRTSLTAALAGDGLTPRQRMRVHYTLAQLHAYDGRMQAAIDDFAQARAIVSATAATDQTAAELTLQTEQALGVAYLHKAELDNGVPHRPGDRCLFTARGVMKLGATADAASAIEHFTRFLEKKPTHLEVRWLLNLAYMAAGGYPDRVPAAHLIPPAAFASTESTPRFVDVAPEVGLDSVAMAGGVIVEDFDKDGLFDVATSSMNVCAPMRLFMRTADGRFAERAAAAGLGEQLGGLNMMQTDFDNDGCRDILVVRGGWDAPQRKSLLRNTCKGTFTDVTVASGLALPVTSTQTAAWTDIDNDGDLDLFVGNENAAAQLFVNNGDGTFTDIAREAGVDRVAFTKGVAAADYDNDGLPDLYVSNFNGRNFLYRNKGQRRFEEVAESAGAAGPGKGFATWFFDYDNDGWSDIFAASYFTSVDEAMRTYLRLPHAAPPMKLYRNTGNGRFEDVTSRTGLDKVLMTMGSNFGDLDNDGFLDIFLGMGNPSYASKLPSVVLRNDGGRTFADVSAATGMGELHKGHGVAFADLDDDGDEELLFEVGGATPNDAHALRLFQNPGHGHDWIRLELAGVKSNRAAIGARITVRITDTAGQTRDIHRTVGSGGSFGASPLAQHIGLGKGGSRVDVDVWWPTSGTRQKFTNLEKNRVWAIQELAGAPVPVARKPLPLPRTRTNDNAARTP